MSDKAYRVSSQPDLLNIANKPQYNITVLHNGKPFFSENTYDKEVIKVLEKLLKKQGYTKLGL